MVFSFSFWYPIYIKKGGDTTVKESKLSQNRGIDTKNRRT